MKSESSENLGQNGESGKTYNPQEMLKGLYDFEDTMESAMSPFFVLGDTADSVKHQKPLAGDGVYVGIFKRHMDTRIVNEILTAHVKRSLEEIKDGFEYLVGEVPVKVQVITGDYEFLNYPDHVIYEYGDYLVPNPWDEYWQKKEEVK